MSLFASELLREIQQTLDAYRAKGWRIITAESCTGGLIAAALTEIPGCSAVFDRAYVTYCNDAKCEMLNVSPALIEAHGAVSQEVAHAMAEGAIRGKEDQYVSIAATGVAGPSGGSEQKPVGTVHIASARHGKQTLHKQLFFPGNRTEIRLATVKEALALLQTRLEGH